MKGLSESQIVSALTHKLGQMGAHAQTEVAVFSQSADVIATTGRAVYAFEAKISDWRRAVRQAATHRLVADYVYIVIPESTYNPTLEECLSTAGVGLIRWSPTTDELVLVHPSPRSTIVFPSMKDKVRKTLEEMRVADA